MSDNKLKFKQKTSARLYAVQGVYQILLGTQTASSFFVNDHQQPIHKEQEMVDVVGPDQELWRAVVGGVEKSRPDLIPVLNNILQAPKTIDILQDQEPLLLAILLCGAYELMAHTTVDAPIIVSDYIDVTKSYYEGNESKFINGILDKVKVLYRTV